MNARTIRLLFAVLCGWGGAVADDGGIHVSAYYYPWYHTDGRHWSEGYDGQGTGRAPALGEYSSRDAGVVEQHLGISEKAGIDNWICSWWGPDSWEDETLRSYVLPKLEGRATTFCILYESEGLLGLDEQEGIRFDSATTEKFLSHIRFLCDHCFNHPAYLRIDGRPVVYLYLSRCFAGDYERALLRARAVAEARGHSLYLVGDEVYWGEPDPERIAQYDAVTAYNLHGPTGYGERGDWVGFVIDCGEVYRSHRAAAAERGVAFIPGVIPGFDTRGHHYAIPRELFPGAGPDTALAAFLGMAKECLDPALRSVAVTSFNEWHEGTQIEPSKDGENGGGVLKGFLKPEGGR